MRDLAKCAQLVAHNPVECAWISDRLVRTFYSEIMRCDLNDEIRINSVDIYRPGAFGHIINGYDVTEAQGRGDLHFHGLFNCRSTPKLISQYAHHKPH